MKRAILLAGLLAALSPASPAAAQIAQRQSLAGGAVFQGYQFGKGAGVDVANLMLVPIAFEQPLGRRLMVDIYTGYARGAVELDGTEIILDGPIDTRLRGTWQPTPWAVLTLGLNLPTGEASRTSNEAVVAGALATELLGFREASWGSGFGYTTGLATAQQIGGWAIGLGASYRVSDGFEPRADTTLNFEPGNEARVRLGIDRNFGRSVKLTGGLTFQNYTSDQIGGRDLFRAGNRWRGDLALSFRTGRASTWTLYAADVWREQGDLIFDIIDENGAVVGDTTFVVGTQNIVVGGLAGVVGIGSGFSIRPSLEGRMQMREDDAGEGWLVGAGLDVPLRLFGRYDVFPSAKVLYGGLDNANQVSRSLWGGEAGLTITWRGGR